MLGSGLVRYRLRKGGIYPLWLSLKTHSQLVKLLIDFLNSQEGKKRKNIDFSAISCLVGDEKLALGLFKTLTMYFFEFTASRDKQNLLSPSLLREKLFRKVSLEKKGFVRREERFSFLKQFIEEMNLDLNVKELEDFLWSTEKDEEKLVKKKEPKPEEVIGYYNFMLLNSLLRHSSSITLNFSTESKSYLGSGHLLKEVIYRVKRKGLLFNAFLKHNSVTLRISGPYELFSKPTKYGEKISSVLVGIFPLMKSFKPWLLKAHIHLNRKDYVLKIDSVSPPLLWQPQLTFLDFNSKVEKQLFWNLSTLQDLILIREPGLIPVGDKVFLPDFKIKYKGKEVYLEVIGYWRKEYIEKKIEVLKEISKKQNLKMLFLIDKKLKSFFEKFNLPIIYFERKGERYNLPYFQIKKAIESI